MRYRKKPIAIEAFQFTNVVLGEEGPEWANDKRITFANGKLRINTLEGVMTAEPGDYIILGIAGEIYPCKPKIFEATYEAVE